MELKNVVNGEGAIYLVAKKIAENHYAMFGFIAINFASNSAIITPHVTEELRAEFGSCLDYLLNEKAALSVDTISGFRISKI